jgi:hypothetical protein
MDAERRKLHSAAEGLESPDQAQTTHRVVTSSPFGHRNPTIASRISINPTEPTHLAKQQTAQPTPNNRPYKHGAITA